MVCISELSICVNFWWNIEEYGEKEFILVEFVFGLKLIKLWVNIFDIVVEEFLWWCRVEEVVGLYVWLIVMYKFVYFNREFDLYFVYSLWLIVEMLGLNGIYMCNMGYKILYFFYRMVNVEFVVCFVLLLMYMGWNVEIFMMMFMDMVEMYDDYVWI